MQDFATALEEANRPTQTGSRISSGTGHLQEQSPQLSSQASSSNPSLELLNNLYREGVIAQAQGDLERAESLWQQIFVRDPTFMNGTFAPLLTKLRQQVQQQRVQRLRDRSENAFLAKDWKQAIGFLRELLKLEPQDAQGLQRLEQCLRLQADEANKAGEQAQEINTWKALLKLQPRDAQALQRLEHRLRLQAKQASSRGEWEQEIRTWNALLALKPQDAQARRPISLAEQNRKHEWHYQYAQQFFTEGNTSSATTELSMLWDSAPYYGDPVGLAKRLEIGKEPRTPADYDREKEQEEEARRKTPSWFIQHQLDITPFAVYCGAFYLLSGLGCTVGMLTQSRLWAVSTVVLATALTYMLGYRRAASLTTMITIATISGAIAFGLAWYMSTFNYSLQQIPDTCCKMLWIGGEVDAGLVYGTFWGAICGFCIFITFNETDLDEVFPNTSVISKSPAYLYVPIASTIISYIVGVFLSIIPILFGWYFGRAEGAQFSLIGTFITIVSGTGLGGSLYVWVRANKTTDRTIAREPIRRQSRRKR